MNSTDYYKILGLPVGASHQEVKATRRTLLLEWHPDRVAHNQELHAIALEKAKQINIAADFLLAQPPVAPPPPSASHNQHSHTNPGNSKRTTAAEDEEKQSRERQQRQAAEDAKQRQQQKAEEKRQQEAEEKRLRKEALAKEQQAQRKAQQETEGAKRAEQHKQREAAGRKMTTRFRNLQILFFIFVFVSYYVTHRSTSSVFNATNSVSSVESNAPLVPATPSQAQPEQNTNSLSPEWLQIREGWVKNDNGYSLLGFTLTQTHNVLGQPTVSFQRQSMLLEEMWFMGTSEVPEYQTPGLISIIYKNGKVIQVENVCSNVYQAATNERFPYNLGKIVQKLPDVHLSVFEFPASFRAVYSINLSKEATEAKEVVWDEAIHFRDDQKVSYFDDVQDGIAFTFSSQLAVHANVIPDEITKQTPCDSIIVHIPGMAVIPASHGENTSGKMYD